MGRPKTEEKSFTAPTSSKSDLVKALETLAPTVDKGQSGDVASKIFDNLESKFMALLNAVAPAAIKADELAEKIYQKLLKIRFLDVNWNIYIPPKPSNMGTPNLVQHIGIKRALTSHQN